MQEADRLLQQALRFADDDVDVEPAPQQEEEEEGKEESDWRADELQNPFLTEQALEHALLRQAMGRYRADEGYNADSPAIEQQRDSAQDEEREDFNPFQHVLRPNESFNR